MDSEEYFQCEEALEKEYRLCRATRQKLPWCYGVGCAYVSGVESVVDIVRDTRVMCSQSGGQGGSGVKLDLENIQHINQSGKYQLIAAMNIADMRKPLVPGAEGMCIVKTLSYQAGGEGVQN